ncbi:OmpA family protein [Fluviicola taffensis]|uniref:OmpA/MotB domain protein n=1 Tax=Fluviicola taffensis (strain DSM 16823 / NCIMB 13979 / RW262) TaxID=755732 RepID=F2IKC9_FLUTR|nr:OmpA family protein [Fluviicola taffensis]AEA44032.1 OmpA/MotB domain protein [Fluviicola taffensis DSM 16823]
MKKTILFAASCLLISWVSAQEKNEVIGTTQLSDYDYYASVNSLEKVKDKDAGVLRKLAVGYDMIGNYPNAEACYATLCKRQDRIPNDHLEYARSLMKSQKYKEAEAQLKIYSQLNPKDSEMDRFELLNESLEKYSAQAATIKVQNAPFNTEQADFGPVIYNGKLLFTSSRRKSEAVNRTWLGNHLSFLDLYVADINPSNNDVTNIQPIPSKKVNKKYHEGPVAFSPDGKQAYITRNNYGDKSIDGTRHFALYVSNLVGGTWSEPEPVVFNSNDYSVGHATFSPDGKTLFFASDMPGGKGGVDIYRSRWQDGNWSIPENMASINTSSNEMFPFLHESGVFFFCSEGYPGYGGLDVFIGQYKDDDFRQLRNVGAPFNSSGDDFSVWMNKDGLTGMISSNRAGGKGNDDLYTFSMEKPFAFARNIHVLAKDEKGNKLPGVLIKVKDTSGKELTTLTTDANAEAIYESSEIGVFNFDGMKKDYFESQGRAVLTDDSPESLNTELVLEKDPGFMLLVQVLDKKSSTVLDSVKVTLINNMTGKEEGVFYTNKDGQIKRPIYDKKLNDRVSYNIRLEKKGYLPKGTTYNKELTVPGVYDVAKDLSLKLEKMEVGTDLAKAIDLKPIYFDLAKYDIRPDAAVELDKIVAIMNEFPTMVIELGSHTDCRGTALKNLELSQKRADASANYIKSKIKDPYRIAGKGYGETKILNGCSCEGPKKQPKYTEAQHSVNRRTEFLVVKI